MTDNLTHFKQTLKIISGNPAEQHYHHFQWDLETEFRRHLTILLASDGRSLLIFHYSGLGFIINNELMLGKGKGKHAY